MANLKKALKYALRIRCPRCGVGKLFFAYGELVENCSQCHLVIRAREPDTWFFMYMSTAAITGIFVMTMLLLPAPKNQVLASALIGVGAILVFFATTPIRKSIAIAIEYVTDSFSQYPRFPDK